MHTCNKVLILVIDGCAPEYITPRLAPNIYRLAEQYGFSKTVKAVVPTVTNVTHASILSGQFPAVTGMVGNYYYDPVTGEEGFIEGKQEKAIETAFNFLKMKVLSPEQISQGTGLPIEKVLELQNQLTAEV